MCMDVESPGPSSGGLVQDSYLVNSQDNQAAANQTVSNAEVTTDMTATSDVENQGNPTMSAQNPNPIEYFDLTEAGDSKNKDLHQSFSFGNDVFGSNLQFDGEVIDLEGNQGSISNVNIYPEGMFDMQAGDNSTHVFEILEKPTSMNLADNVLSTNSILYDATTMNQQFL